MSNLTIPAKGQLSRWSSVHLAVPPVIAAAGERASKRFLEFFTATIRNRNRRMAYARACGAFLAGCEDEGLGLDTIESIAVSSYIEQLLADGMAKPSVKQHLAAIRMTFDWLASGGILPFNPTAAVRGPRYVIKKGKTPVLTPEEARQLLDSIKTEKIGKDGEPDGRPDLKGLRDRALIAVMVYSFARVSAVVGMDVDDYYQQGKRWWLRLHEKGGKHHEVPVHHKAEEYLDAYLAAAGIVSEKNTPLWRSISKKRSIGDKRLSRMDVFQMVKLRCREAGLGAAATCHTFRATGITAYCSMAEASKMRRPSPLMKARARQSFTTVRRIRLRSMRSSGSGFDFLCARHCVLV